MQIELSAHFTLQHADASLGLPLLRRDGVEFGLDVIAGPRSGHLGIAELTLERGEELERIAAPVRLRDLALLFAEQRL